MGVGVEGMWVLKACSVCVLERCGVWVLKLEGCVSRLEICVGV